MSRIEIDGDDLVEAMQNNSIDATWLLDLTTGKISLYFDGMWDGEDTDVDIDDLDPEQYRRIEGIGSSKGFSVMEDFVDQLSEGHAKNALADALSRRKPFRGFKDALMNLGEVRDQWSTFESRAHAEFAKRWLKEEDIDADLVWKTYTS